MISILLCDDCKTDKLNLFVVHDNLWLSVAKRKEVLCINCFEKRLGRTITLKDLKPCLVTYNMFMGAYIASNTTILPSKEILIDAASYKTETREWSF